MTSVVSLQQPLNGNNLIGSQVACAEQGMSYAIKAAQMAQSCDEVPVGAVLVHAEKIIGFGYNQPIRTHDPTAHAEIIALRHAGAYMQNYRMLETTLYVTLEPCAMCMAALVHARIKHLSFGCRDLKAGAVISQMQMLDYPFWNHRFSWQEGIQAEECKQLLQNFFSQRRKQRIIYADTSRS